MCRISTIVACSGLVLLFVSGGYAQVIPSLDLSKDVQGYDINTADNYSLRTRSDTYSFVNVKVSEIATVIRRNLSDYGSISINETLNMLVIKEEEKKLQNILDLCKKLDVQQMDDFLKIRTRRIPLLYNQPSTLAQFLTPYLSVEGKIQYDDNFNVIIVHDHESKLDQIEEEIKKFDVPPKEVKIDVEILAINRGGLLDAGINWDGILDSQIRVNADWYKSYAKDDRRHEHDDSETRDIDKRETRGDREEVDVSLNARLSDIIRILEEKQQVKVISSPSIITLNNRKGHIWVGPREFVEKAYREYEEVKFGLNLSVTPHIGESNLIQMDIECELGDFNNGQKVVNRILAKEGETFLLGGMTKVDEMKVTKRIPILGHILPFIFSRNSTYEEVTDVLLLLTPHLVDVDRFGVQSNEAREQVKKGG